LYDRRSCLQVSETQAKVLPYAVGHQPLEKLHKQAIMKVRTLIHSFARSLVRPSVHSPLSMASTERKKKEKKIRKFKTKDPGKTCCP
jgi:hypothetical protein